MGPPPPAQLPPKACFAPPPFGSRGGGAHSLAGEGALGANSDEGSDTLVNSRYSIIPLQLRIPARETLRMKGRQKDRKGRTESEYTKREEKKDTA
jgi:hypothetical protein